MRHYLALYSHVCQSCLVSAILTKKLIKRELVYMRLMHLYVFILHELLSFFFSSFCQELAMACFLALSELFFKLFFF